MEKIEKLLDNYKNNNQSREEVLSQIKNFLYTDLGYAKIDNIREARVGYPDVIFGLNKSKEQILGIIDHMYEYGSNILATRVNEEFFEAVKEKYNEARYNKTGKTLCIERQKVKETENYIALVSAGTSDLPVVEEAYETARIFGNKVEKITDVGVAGIHRLLDKVQLLREAKVLIVVAGMEGALPSVVGGLVDKPIIAVPTSVGYGANLGGISALLAMLNSCAGGISVVNIDNGFGAAYQASMINKL